MEAADDIETSDCFFCGSGETVVVVGQHWACLKCGKILCQASYETRCTNCGRIIPEDRGFCNDPSGERTFCDQDCHSTFYDD